MSSLWTPSGEHPVDRGRAGPQGAPDGGAGPKRASEAGATEREEVARRLEELTRELVRTPAAVVVANHAVGLYELAVLHLAQKPPNLAEARLAIDALAALVEGLAGRLGDNEPTLREFLTRVRLLFVEVSTGASG